MIVFNELRLDLESNSLILDISVADNPYYSNIRISKICVSSQEDYSYNYIGKKLNPLTTSLDKKSVRMAVNFDTLANLGVALYGNNIKDNMLFIKVYTEGNLGEDSPYIDKPEYIQGITFSTESIYNTMMQFIKSIEVKGEASKDFINYFMQYEALRVSIDTGHHSAAVNLFNKFFKGKLGVPLTTITNCIYG